MLVDQPGEALSFSGHETFPLRYTWLPKAVQRLEQHPDLFTRDDALVILGVGKNMVRSIRHWGRAFGILELDRDSRDQITELGEKLLGARGWDPYLEDPGTLWLLHWNVVSHPEKASTWYFAFTQWNQETFTRQELIDWLFRLSENHPTARSTKGSIERDVGVFIRTYVPAEVKPTLPLEETFDSPLVELGLLRVAEGGKGSKEVYGFVKGPKPMLPDDIFIYALLDYWQRVAPGRQTLAFETLLHGRGSPGAAFKLSENAFVSILERLPRWTGVRFDDTAGMRQLLAYAPEMPEPLAVLERYYTPDVVVT